MSKCQNSNATFWVIFKHCGREYVAFNLLTLLSEITGKKYQIGGMKQCAWLLSLYQMAFKPKAFIKLKMRLFILSDNDGFAPPRLLVPQWPKKTTPPLHTILKVKFVFKNLILTKSQHFHEFFIQKFFGQFFSWNESCQQLKSPKPQHFHEFFTPKKSTIFTGNQSWIFGQKMKISNSVINYKFPKVDEILSVLHYIEKVALVTFGY